MQAKGGPCTTNAGCAADNAGACCVAYTFPYCGVPSDCNSFLRCFSPQQEEAATAAAIEEGASPEDQTAAFADALEKLQMMGGNETDPDMGGMDPSGIVEQFGACVNATTMDIDMQCIQGVLSTLDPAMIGKLAQCAGVGSMAEIQACVEKQLGTPEDGNATMPEDTTSPGTFATTSGFMGFSVVALVAGLFY